MKRHSEFTAVLPVCMSLLLVTGVSAADNWQTEQFEFQPSQTLEFDLGSGGSISVDGWDMSGIEVTYGDRTRSLDAYDISIVNTSQGLSIDAALKEHHGSSSLYFEVKAPRELMLELETAGGSVELHGLVGSFSGSTAGGSLNLVDISGDVDLETGGGTIEVLDSVVDGKVHTGGGEVLVKNVTGDLRATSGGGNVRYVNVHSSDGDLQGPKHVNLDGADEETVVISSAGGRIEIDSAPRGASVYTGGGSIEIKGADHFVSAETGGGGIEIRTAQGRVTATTGGGRIEVTIDENTTGKGDIVLESGAGSIVLNLPEDFSMTLDVELGITENAMRDYEILSDFDIEVEKTDTWDYSKGTPRKHIFGSAKLSGGEHHVTIRATNGNVEVRKTAGR